MNSICFRNAILRAKRILIKTSSQLEQKHTGANPPAWDERCRSVEILGELVPSTPMQAQKHDSYPEDSRHRTAPSLLSPRSGCMWGQLQMPASFCPLLLLCLLHQSDALSMSLTTGSQELRLYLRWCLSLQQPSGTETKLYPSVASASSRDLSPGWLWRLSAF